jgi:hypothetical protein
MAKDEYLEIEALDTTSQSEKLAMALIYLTTGFFLAAFVIFHLKLKDLGIGLFGG